MALPSYLTRRDGRYYLQIRFSRPLAQLSGVSLYRVSLRTGDYRKARQKLTEFLSWILRMNESINFVDLFQKNVVELRQYLSDQLPISEERLHARLHYEEMLKNLRRRALARDCDPEMIAPEFTILFKRFVAQNVEAEGWLRRIENIRHYEQGRADMQTAIALGVIPQGFGMGLGQPPAGVPSIPLPTPFSTVMPSNPLGMPGVELHAAASPKDEDRPAPVWEERTQEQDSGPRPAQEPVAQTTALRFSEALALFEEDDIRNGGNADARGLVLLVVQFIIDKMDDPLLVEFDKEAAARIDAMLPDIPDRKNIPREHTVSLAARYDYARKHGWAGLKRLTEARLKNGYHNALSRFFGWLIEQKLYPFEKPQFSRTSEENLVSIERDAFSMDEVIRIFSLPLFTGCLSAERIWVEGDHLVQNHLYWGYVLSFLTGLRPGEIGQIELDDIEEQDGIYYLQLRAFNPREGRVARKDVKRFKTLSSQRTIPLHPLILDLGLLERVEDLRSIGCPVLFPEWEPYPKPGGEMRWGQPLTKSFQYLRRKIGLDRFDVALYSSRHWFADLIDNSDIKDVTRRRLMGHSAKKDIPSRYGRKQRLTNRDLAQLTTISSPIIDEMAKLLLQARDRASRGELRVLKPWLTPSNWSDYYRQRLFQKARLEARRWAQEGHAEATANAVSLCRRKRFRSVVICFARICSIDPRWGRTTLHQS